MGHHSQLAFPSLSGGSLCTFSIPKCQKKSWNPQRIWAQDIRSYETDFSWSPLPQLQSKVKIVKSWHCFWSTQVKLLNKLIHCFVIIQITVSHHTNCYERRQAQRGGKAHYHYLQINYQIASAMPEANGEMSSHSLG